MPPSFYAGVALRSGSDKWSTPQAFFDEQNARFCFTLDVCASRENAKCARYFSQEVEGWRSHGVARCAG